MYQRLVRTPHVRYGGGTGSRLAVALEAAFRALISLSAGNLVDKAIIERNREALFWIVALLA